jgi:hypothetical protein
MLYSESDYELLSTVKELLNLVAVPLIKLLEGHDGENVRAGHDLLLQLLEDHQAKD